MERMQRLFFTVFILIIPFGAFAQHTDSAVVPQSATTTPAVVDSTPQKNTVIAGDSSLEPGAHPFITPKKTALFSAILPGLGQAYNHQYWKIPIIYAGLGVAAYFINDNLKNYNTFRKLYAGRISNDPASFLEYPEYSNDVVKQARDFYRKNLDLTVLLTAVGYTLQILDAVVFAHLKNFDISPNISFHARPVVSPQGGFGLGLVMNF